VERNICAVGGQKYISFIDSRVGKVVKSIESHDEEWGVRSICFNGNLLSSGGGLGRVSFYDICADGWLSLDSSSRSSSSLPYVEVGRGYVDVSDHYVQMFTNVNRRMAIYTHHWDQSKTRLFMGGGPLLLGLKGCYAAMW